MINVSAFPPLPSIDFSVLREYETESLIKRGAEWKGISKMKNEKSGGIWLCRPLRCVSVHLYMLVIHKSKVSCDLYEVSSLVYFLKSILYKAIYFIHIYKISFPYHMHTSCLMCSEGPRQLAELRDYYILMLLVNFGEELEAFIMEEFSSHLSLHAHASCDTQCHSSCLWWWYWSIQSHPTGAREILVARVSRCLNMPDLANSLLLSWHC